MFRGRVQNSRSNEYFGDSFEYLSPRVRKCASLFVLPWISSERVIPGKSLELQLISFDLITVYISATYPAKANFSESTITKRVANFQLTGTLVL